jgi:phosphoglycerate kinase
VETPFFRKSLFVRALVTIVVANLILGSGPLYAYTDIYNLRTPAARHGVTEEIIEDLSEGDSPQRVVHLRSPRIVRQEAAAAIGALTMDDLGDVTGRHLLVRPDVNAPVKDGQISLTDRIIESAKTIKEAAERNARVVVIGHQGRVGDADYLESMQQHAQLLSKEIGRPVKYVHDLYGKDAMEAILSLKDGEILMLKNLRPGEEDPQFVANLEPLFFAFINDAFSVSHRKQAGVVGFSNIPNVAGRLMQRELEGNRRFLTAVQHPYIELLGGAKISDHLDALRYGLDNGLIDRVLTGGLLGQLLLLSEGYKLGEATEKVLRTQDVDEKKRPEGLLSKGFLDELNSIYTEHKDKFELPVDLAYADEQGQRQEISVEDLPEEGIPFLIADNGTRTAERYASIIKDAKTGFEKGPMGNYKNTEFRKGSEIVYKAVAENVPFWMTGGGDTDVLNQELGLTPSHRTLAGGAYLEFKAGKPLPGVLALENSAKNVLRIAEALNVDKPEILSFIDADKSVYRTMGGELLRSFVNTLFGITSSKTPTRALIASSNFMRIPGAKSAVAEVARGFAGAVKVALYGTGAEKLKALFESEDIITAESLDDVLAKLSQLGISTKDILVLSSPEDGIDRELGMRQIMTRQLSTLAVAKALEELFNESALAANAFEIFFDNMAEVKIIPKQVQQNVRDDVLAELEENGVFEFPDELRPDSQVIERIEVASRTYEGFMIQI